MRKYILLFFSALLFVWACKYKSAPKGIIKPDDMIKVLVQVHLVDGSLTNIPGGNNDSLYKYSTDRYAKVFKRMHTDTLQFRNSVKYYAMHPDQFEEMYNQVVKILQDKADSLNKPVKTADPKNALPKK